MKPQELLDKYYRGETTLEEEKELKQLRFDDKNFSAEKDMFSFYQNEGAVPEDLEDTLFNKLDLQKDNGSKVRLQLLRFISAAAVIVVILSVYFNLRTTKNEQLENEFFTMENALYQVAESLQPEEQEEMMVLWVDDNVEIIIH